MLLSLRTKLLVTGIFLCVALGATTFFAVQTIQAIQRFQEEHALTLADDVSLFTGSNLKSYDAVMFYTTGELPMSDEQKRAFAAR